MDKSIYDKKLVWLRDCFTAGYNIPAYCKNHNITYPLIISDDEKLLWEIFIQFKYKKISKIDFRLISKSKITNYTHSCIAGAINFKQITPAMDINKYDKIILLAPDILNYLPANKTIIFDKLIDDFIKYTYCERPLLHFLSINPDVKIIISNHPVLFNDNNASADEKFILSRSIHTLRKDLIDNKDVDFRPYSKLGYNKEQTIKLLSLSGSNETLNGATLLIDNDDELINIKNGQRETAYNNMESKNTIYVMGTCSFFGIGAPYNKTFESYLAKVISANNLPYKVVNASQFYAGRYQDIFYNLNNLPVLPGDIILIYLQDLYSSVFPLFNTRNIFKRPHPNGEVFADGGHLNENGYKILADKFYDYLISNNFFKDFTYPDYTFDEPHYYGIPQLAPPPIFSNITNRYTLRKIKYLYQ